MDHDQKFCLQSLKDELDNCVDKEVDIDNKGKILCGVSAGSICWCDKGVTDSWASNLSVLDCLGFIKGK